MGWTSTTKPSGMTAAEYLKRNCLTWSNLPALAHPVVVAEASGAGCIAFAVRFPAAYFEAVSADSAAWWRKVYVPALDGSITTALLFLVSNRNDDGYNFGYKDMAETSGPNATVAPSILKHLSELIPGTDSATWAASWRDRCKSDSVAKADARKKAAAVKPGVKVRFAEPIKFRDGSEHREFIAESCRIRRGRKMVETIAYSAGGSLFRLPGKVLANAEIVQ